MRIGVDYYPEHWDRKMWSADARLMAETGVKLVRLAEFAWCRLEPSDGVFDFDWLDDAVRIFADHGIDVVIGTPTNCPPRWLCEKHPDILPVGDSGKTNPIGIRGHRCMNSPVFREYAGRIVDRLAAHYKNFGNVIAWQIDNELEANICYCETCTDKHREWLKNKYGTIEALNRAYGNVVWSGEYSSWEQVDPPYGGYNPAWLNPAYMLDLRRRAAEDVTEFAEFQADIFRSHIPGAKITTNTWFCSNIPAFRELFADLDFVSYDNYPATGIPDDYEDIYTHAPHLDLMRGIKRKDFWIMEQLSGGIGCWMPMQKTTRPGMIKGYALQAFAHGADTVVHFRWRTANTGAEMHWHGLIDHSNVPGRRFAEFAELCREAEGLADLRGTELHADAAVLFSPESEAAFKLQPQTDGFSYMEQIKLIHQAFARYGVNVDIIDEHEDISQYKIICVPALYIVNDDTVSRLYSFARSGGTVVITARSGVKDSNNNCIMEQLPTVYKELAGCHVSEYDPIGWSRAKLRFTDGAVFDCRQWCDILETDTAEALACYDSDFYAGKPAVTVNRYGSGTAYYIGTVGERRMYEKLAKTMLDDSGIPYIAELPENVEVTVRTGNGVAAMFVFNNSGSEKTVHLDGKDITLEPFGMSIIRK
ncbi:MAG: beta-galactosidase [Ruminiclostridium sp.]|nr:beta-galactosidase [Ruminiclostridium sp.]